MFNVRASVLEEGIFVREGEELFMTVYEWSDVLIRPERAGTA